MIIEWWFDISGRIGRIEMDIGVFGSPKITIDDSVDAEFIERKQFRSGTSSLYKTADGHGISVNDVKFRGERYVSLYIDRKLIKEYQVYAEKYKAIYMNDPDVYDSKRKFIARAAVFAVCLGAFSALACVILLALAGIIASSVGVGLYFAVILPLVSLIAFLAQKIFYSERRKKMIRYSIISSIDSSRRKRKKKKKQPFISIR